MLTSSYVGCVDPPADLFARASICSIDTIDDPLWTLLHTLLHQLKLQSCIICRPCKHPFEISQPMEETYHLAKQRSKSYSCGMAALACTDLAILIDVLEITSVWKKFAMLLRKGSDCALTLLDLSLKACTQIEQILCYSPILKQQVFSVRALQEHFTKVGHVLPSDTRLPAPPS